MVKRPGHDTDQSSNLVPRLRMCGTIPPLAHFAFMRCTRKTLPITSLNNGYMLLRVPTDTLFLFIHVCLYSITQIIRINLDGQPSGYAENPDN